MLPIQPIAAAVAEFALRVIRVLMHAVIALRGRYSVGRFVATRKNVLAEDLDIRLFVTHAHPVCTLVIVLASILRQMTKIAATVATLAVGMAQTVTEALSSSATALSRVTSPVKWE